MKKFLLTFGVLAASLYASVAEATITASWDFTNDGMAVNGASSANFLATSANLFASGLSVVARGGAYYYYDDWTNDKHVELGTVSNLAGGLAVHTDMTVNGVLVDPDVFTTNTILQPQVSWQDLTSNDTSFAVFSWFLDTPMVNVSGNPQFNMLYQEYLVLDMTNVLNLLQAASNVSLTLSLSDAGSLPYILGSSVTATNDLTPTDLQDSPLQAFISTALTIDFDAIGLSLANPYLIITKSAFDTPPSLTSPSMTLEYMALSFDNCVYEGSCTGGGGDDDVPEPGLIGLFGFSLAGLAALRWRR